MLLLHATHPVMSGVLYTVMLNSSKFQPTVTLKLQDINFSNALTVYFVCNQLFVYIRWSLQVIQVHICHTSYCL